MPHEELEKIKEMKKDARKMSIKAAEILERELILESEVVKGVLADTYRECITLISHIDSALDDSMRSKTMNDRLQYWGVADKFYNDLTKMMGAENKGLRKSKRLFSALLHSRTSTEQKSSFDAVKSFNRRWVEMIRETIVHGDEAAKRLEAARKNILNPSDKPSDYPDVELRSLARLEKDAKAMDIAGSQILDRKMVLISELIESDIAKRLRGVIKLLYKIEFYADQLIFGNTPKETYLRRIMELQEEVRKEWSKGGDPFITNTDNLLAAFKKAKSFDEEKRYMTQLKLNMTSFIRFLREYIVNGDLALKRLKAAEYLFK